MKKEEIKKINKLRSLFPAEITVNVHRSELGKYCAEITTYPGCFTEADSFSGLIEMVNDAARTYFEIPKKYLSFMPNYMPPIELAQKFSIFPFKETTKKLIFENTDAEINCENN
jgi:hypothetical protein